MAGSDAGLQKVYIRIAVVIWDT